VPDGLRVDEHGNVWVTGPGGIWVIGPDGVQLGLIETPEFPANLAFGDPDGQTLYITATRSLYRVRTLVRGARPA
jgi:gluconolactonase